MRQFSFISFLFLALHAISQEGEFNFAAHGQLRNVIPGDQLRNMVNPYWLTESARAGADISNYPGVNGTPFFKTNCTKGYILFSDNSVIKNVLISFNVYTNEIYFFMNNRAMVLNTTIPAVQFGLQSEEDSNYATVFRRGFPPSESFTSQTFYNVLAVGRIMLLKHLNKSIVERKNSLSVPEQFFSDSESWYLFDASEKKMIAVKKNKNSFLEALPQYNQQMLAIIESKKLKLKSEADYISLINELDNKIN